LSGHLSITTFHGEIPMLYQSGSGSVVIPLVHPTVRLPASRSALILRKHVLALLLFFVYSAISCEAMSV
jgi:hypothetical protein